MIIDFLSGAGAGFFVGVAATLYLMTRTAAPQRGDGDRLPYPWSKGDQVWLHRENAPEGWTLVHRDDGGRILCEKLP